MFNDIPVNENLIEINQLGVFIPICPDCVKKHDIPDSIRQAVDDQVRQCANQGCINTATQEVVIPFTRQEPGTVQ